MGVLPAIRISRLRDTITKLFVSAFVIAKSQSRDGRGDSHGLRSGLRRCRGHVCLLLESGVRIARVSGALQAVLRANIVQVVVPDQASMQAFQAFLMEERLLAYVIKLTGTVNSVKPSVDSV